MQVTFINGALCFGEDPAEPPCRARSSARWHDPHAVPRTRHRTAGPYHQASVLEVAGAGAGADEVPLDQ